MIKVEQRAELQRQHFVGGKSSSGLIRKTRFGELLRDARAVGLAAYLGLRLEELLELHRGDVRWGQSEVLVARNISDGVISTPKAGKRRDIPLGDPAAGL